jgi:hypothetical protein
MGETKDLNYNVRNALSNYYITTQHSDRVITDFYVL